MTNVFAIFSSISKMFVSLSQSKYAHEIIENFNLFQQSIIT